MSLFNHLMAQQVAGGSCGRTPREKFLQLFLKAYILLASCGTATAMAMEGHYAFLASGSVGLSILAAIVTFVVLTRGCVLFGFISTYIFMYHDLVRSTFSALQSSIEGTEQTLARYRLLALICNRFNYGAYCGVVVPTLKVFGSFLSMTIVLASAHMRLASETLPVVVAVAGVSYVFLLIAFFACVILTMAVNCMSGFWTMSVEHISRCRKRLNEGLEGDKDRRYARKLLYAAAPLKFRVGGLYNLEIGRAHV